MARRSSGHRAQLGGARSAREAALRKRLPPPLEKRCFSSASQTRQPAFWQGVLAIHGAALLASTGPGLAIHGKAFRLSKAALLIGCADQPSPIHGAALLASTGPGLAIHGKAFRLSKAALLIGCADQPSPIHGAALVASTGPGLAIHGKAFRLSKAALLIGCADQPSPIHGAALAVSTGPGLDILSSRSSGHRAQLGGARSAREAALRKRLPPPLEKRCFSSASQTRQPAFWQGVLAIHGAALLASTGPGLAIHGKAFRLSKAALLIGCADQPSPIHGAALVASTGPGLDILSSRSSGHRAQLGGARSAREAALRKRLPSPLEKRCFSSASQTGQPAFWQGVLAIHGAALLASIGPGLDILSSRSALEKRCFSSASQTGQPAFWQGVLAIHGAALLASIGPGLDILSSRSALEKRCFSSASQTGPHPFRPPVFPAATQCPPGCSQALP